MAHVFDKILSDMSTELGREDITAQEFVRYARQWLDAAAPRIGQQQDGILYVAATTGADPAGNLGYELCRVVNSFRDQSVRNMDISKYEMGMYPTQSDAINMSDTAFNRKNR